MFFIRKNNSKTPVSILRLKTLVRARSVISLYPMRGTETLLDNYLVENHKLTLKNACLLILANLQVSLGKDDELIMFFKDPKYDKLSKIITFGVDNIPGSQILKEALGT